MSAVDRNMLSIASLIETAWVLLLTFVSYILFLIFLYAVFPIGGGFDQGFFSRSNPQSMASHQSTDELQLIQEDKQKKLSQSDDYTALLGTTTNNVRRKRAGGVTWKIAKRGRKLFSGDSIQTGNNSTAIVEFDAKNFLNIGEKSLVVIRRMEKDILLPEKQSVVFMDRGQIWGRVQQNNRQSAYVEIVTPDLSAKVSGRGKQNETEFQVSVDEKQRSSLVVFNGEVEVKAADQTLTVVKNQQLRVDKNKTLQPIETLLPPITTIGPKENKRFFYQDLPPLIDFKWQKLAKASDYRLIIATDPAFLNIIMDVLTRNTTFSHGNLNQGKYYWRVFAKSSAKYGEIGPTHIMHIIRDLTPPKLKVEFTNVVTPKGLYLVQGKTETGAIVFVGGQQVKPDANGEFNFEYPLSAGINQIVVEAMDEAQNTAYQTHTFNYKP